MKHVPLMVDTRADPAAYQRARRARKKETGECDKCAFPSDSWFECEHCGKRFYRCARLAGGGTGSAVRVRRWYSPGGGSSGRGMGFAWRLR